MGLGQRARSGPVADIGALAFEVPEPMFIAAADGVILRLNPAFTERTGYPEAELVGQSLSILQSDAQDANFCLRLGQQLKAERSWRGLIACRYRDGSLRWQMLRVDAVHSGEQEPVYWVGRLQDHGASDAEAPRALSLSERLAQKNQSLEAILNGMQVGTWEWHIKTGETTFNRRWAEIIGETLDSLAPISIQTWLARVHPEDAPHSEAELQRHFAGETEIYTCEVRMRHRDGHWVWVLDRGWVTEWADDGTPLHMVGGHIDVTEHYQAQARLREQEFLYRTLLENVSDAVFLASVEADGSFRYRASNPALRQLSGLGEIIGKRPGEVLSPTAAAHVERQYRACVQRRARLDYEETFDLPAGQMTWATSLTPIFDAAGEVELIAGIGHDITAAKRAQAVSVERERRLSELFDAIPDGVVLLDPATGLPLQFNAKACQQLGYQRAEFAALSVKDYELLEGAEAIAARMRRIGDQGMDSFETRHRRKDGSAMDVQVSVRVVDWDGKPTFLCVFHDVTQSKRLQHELQRARDRLASYTQWAPLGVYVADSSGRYTEVNKAACEQGGFSQAELLAMRIEEYVWPEDLALGAQHFATVCDRGVAVGELRFRRKGGGFFWGAVFAGLLPDGDAIAFVETTTEKVALQERLQRSNAELEQFAYVVSHDLRQPLRMIVSYTQLIERQLDRDFPAKLAQYFEQVRSGALRMDEMLTGLLDYSRVGRIGDPMESISSRELLDEALHYLGPSIDESGADVTITGDWPTLWASRNEGVRLFQNLISNAIKFVPAGRSPMVHLSVEPRPGGWCFSISDNGVGIDLAQKDRLFKVFQRLHTRTEYEGTGIGLSICRRILERYGGEIWIDSDGPDQGATVAFFIPAQQRAD